MITNGFAFHFLGSSRAMNFRKSQRKHGFGKNVASASGWLLSFLIVVLAQLSTASAADAPTNDVRPLIQLAPGDSVSLQVYGQPDMNGALIIDSDGTIDAPLAGHIRIAGMSPVEAGSAVESALVSGQFLVNPHVTVTVLQSHSQKVTVTGEVRTPGRYPMETTSSVVDLIALAGGATDNAASTVFILRPDGAGGSTRISVDIGSQSTAAAGTKIPAPQGGDTIVVPKANHYYIYGEVLTPNMYRLEPGLTVLEAITRAGGITARGSEHRVDIKRAREGGRYVVTSANLSDIVQPDDVIRVKESIF